MAEAIDKAVNLCIKESILAEFLIKNRSEVMNVLLTEYDMDAHMRATREEAREEARKEEQLYGIKVLIAAGRRYQISKENIRRDLMAEYSLEEKDANQYLDLYWE